LPECAGTKKYFSYKEFSFWADMIREGIRAERGTAFNLKRLKLTYLVIFSRLVFNTKNVERFVICAPGTSAAVILRIKNKK
jgi:hypothetical protein